MKVILINTIDNRGGAAKVAYRLKNGLNALGHKVSMFVAKKLSMDNDVFLVQKQNLFESLIKKTTGRDAGRYLREKIYKIFPSDIDFFNMRGLFKSAEYKESDIVHCHNLSAGYFNLNALPKIAAEKPLVWTLHDMWAITYGTPHTYGNLVHDGFFQVVGDKNHYYHDALAKNKNYLENRKRNIYNKMKMHLVVPSLWLKNKIEKSILKDKPITLIYNGIDESVFKPYDKSKARQELGLPLDKKIITFIATGGQAVGIKGWDYVEKTMKRLPDNDIVFLSVGGLKNRPPIGSKDKRVTFMDYIEDETRLSKLYSASDVFLFTSIAENFPLVVLEAMSCGLPVVSFDVGGVKEAVLHKENGYIAEYKNSDDLARGIEYILALTEEELRKMSENSVQRVKNNFSLGKMTREYAKLYESLL